MKLGFIQLVLAATSIAVVQGSKFWDDFYVNFGDGKVQYPGYDTGSTIALGLDNTTGSGFQSKYPYLYGNLSMQLKLVGGNSAGTVTSYYMASDRTQYSKWCELDFEFLGNASGEPYILQTNVFSEGVGNREQRIYLWFDPTADYHEYGILWNQDLILFLVDSRVIRVFHNAADLGIPYLDYQPMYIYSSIWNGESWATCGGGVKTDWSLQPFLASYTNFNVWNACEMRDYTQSSSHACFEKLYSSSYGQAPNLALTQSQIDDLRWIKYNYVIYDYCTDLKRFNWTAPPECARNWTLELPN
ncbi:hypothetical protein MARPO_1415s0001, partial [Marchantia polymorpha]